MGVPLTDPAQKQRDTKNVKAYGSASSGVGYSPPCRRWGNDGSGTKPVVYPPSFMAGPPNAKATDEKNRGAPGVYPPIFMADIPNCESN